MLPTSGGPRARTDRALGASADGGRLRRSRGEWRVVVPVLDEAAALPALLAEIAAIPGLLERTVFVDNGSTDESAALIRAAGGRVVEEARRGYGFACLAGVAAAFEPASLEPATGARTTVGQMIVGPSTGARTTVEPGTSPRPPAVRAVAFMEADGTDDPVELHRLVGPVLARDVDLLVGSRRRAVRAGAPMAPHQRWGNVAAVTGMRVLFGISLPDNGPFRAIRLDLLDELGMEPRGYAWTTEMVVKAHLSGARVSWVDTHYRARAGRSKISGTLRGTAGAFRGIFGTLLRLRLRGGVRMGRRRRSGRIVRQ
ncbi:MAG: glycosyltransferase family 2 protein [Thermoleophilia bacterium]